MLITLKSLKRPFKYYMPKMLKRLETSRINYANNTEKVQEAFRINYAKNAEKVKGAS